MTTSNFNVRMDDTLKAQATQVFESYGLSPTQAIKLFFNQVVKTNKVPLVFDYNENDNTNQQDSYEPNATTLRALAEIQANQAERYASPDHAMQAMLTIAK